MTEVEVDGYSGHEARASRVDILHDVGDSLNPGVDRGQIEGGFVQGMGWLTGEELQWDEDGRAAHALGEHVPDPVDRRRARATSTSTLLANAAQPGVDPRQQGRRRAAADARDQRARGDPRRDRRVRRAGGEVPLPSPATHEAIYLTIRQRLRDRPLSIAAEE